MGRVLKEDLLAIDQKFLDVVKDKPDYVLL